MIDFVGTPHLLRFTLWVAMVTIHFHVAQTGSFLVKHFFRIQGIPGNNCPGVQGKSK